MDTKQKSRPGDTQRRKRPANSKQAGKRRPAQEQSQTQNAARQKGTDARRQPQQQRRPAMEPEKTARKVESSAEEVVFHPAPQPRQPRNKKQDSAEEKRATRRRQSAQRAQERKQQEKLRKNRPAVTYTQPKPFNLNRLLLQLAVVLAVVAAITMGLSVFFKVKNVVVYGNNAYGAWTIQEASGIEAGDKLLSLNNARASGKIKAALPYVDTVRIGIKLPDTVNIYIEEFDVAYAIQTEDGTWWLMTSAGRVVEQIDGGTASSYTKVLGVTLDSPVAGEQAKAVVTTSGASDADAASSTDSTEETVPVTVTGTDRLNAALQILSCMEDNDIVGEVASVDVTSLTNIELWYGQRYQVKLGNTEDVEKKITYMKQAVSQLSDYEMGVLDVSFTTWPDQAGYTPFE